MSALTGSHSSKPIPFDSARLDALLDDAGIDVLIATSKHNVQYLLGGYRFFFFDYMDAIGMSRYLPIFVYHKGKAENSAYIGTRLSNGSVSSTSSGRLPSTPRPGSAPMQCGSRSPISAVSVTVSGPSA
jgi:Xaa-Pro aminopeptidase